MNSVAIVVDVMFGVYLMNVMGAFVNRAFADRPVMRERIEWVVGAALLLLVLVLGT